ncbi:hypothetical protein [Magnetovibrio sp.]|uniref:hypothetical protein n=1 Tax=Magnetovibrio sp. TaxID=2024836 RepID=UPI002F93D711
MTPEHNTGDAKPFRSLSYQAIQTLTLAYPVVLRLALLPFVLSVGVVILARLVGPPERYAFDALHGLFLLSFITSVSRVAQSRALGRLVTGPSFLGLAVPNPRWPGVMALLGMIAECLLLMVPTALVLFVIAAFIGGALGDVELGHMSVALHILPEFILNTWLGLVIGAGMAKIAADRNA